MADEGIAIKKSTLLITIVFVSVLLSLVSLMYFSSPFTAPFVFSLLLVLWAAYYVHSKRSHLNEMCCMMSGMAFGMIGGFFIGTLAALVTADFLVGIVVGTASGLVFGVPMGKMGGSLGRMEGVMAGPMGGMMGGMLGIMIRFYNVELFMPFFIFVVILTVWEMVYVIYQHAGKKISSHMIILGAIISLAALSSAIAADFSGIEGGAFFGAARAAPSEDTTAVKNGIQEINMRLEALGYSPNYIVVKKDIPVRINLQAAPDAGCTRSIVFPDFGIRKLLPRGGSDVVEFTPQKPGTYQFRCSMAMAGGTLVVQ